MSYKPQSFKNDLDCPGCKYGPLKKWVDRDVAKFKCIDCNRVFTIDQLKAKGVKV